MALPPTHSSALHINIVASIIGLSGTVCLNGMEYIYWNSTTVLTAFIVFIIGITNINRYETSKGFGLFSSMQF